jgi:transcription termination factor Rho
MVFCAILSVISALPNDVWVSPNLIKKPPGRRRNRQRVCQRVNNRLELRLCNRLRIIRPGFPQPNDIRPACCCHPHQRFELGANQNVSMRIIDLIAPIGKGTRG